MAPSAGHVHKLVVRNYKIFKAVFKNVSNQFKSRIPLSIRDAHPELQPISIRAAGARGQPIHPAAYLKQIKSRLYSTSTRKFSSSAARGVKFDKASFPKSRTATAVNASTGRAPFASTLRPNLTGGVLNRTAGGYGLGSGRVGGARYFSHTPTAPAQVIQNVSQAVRAFWVSGSKAQFNGSDPITGNKRYRAVSNLQESTSRKLRTMPKATPGSVVEFNVNPTITALTPLNNVAGCSGFENEIAEDLPRCHLNTDGLLDCLHTDFSRALKDLAAVMNDIKTLSSLGDLPLSYQSSSLRVHFPGCDRDTVESLCRELGVKRGIVIQDEDFDSFAGTEIALLFPFAPSDSEDLSDAESLFSEVQNEKERLNWRDAPLFPSDLESNRSNSDLEVLDFSEGSGLEKRRYSPIFGESDLEDSVDDSASPLDKNTSRNSRSWRSSSRTWDSGDDDPFEYHDFEGIYRFIEMCDDARR